jgi:hypothetical protein
MKSAHSTRQKHEVPWTFVASAKRASPRRVLVSQLEPQRHGSKPRSVSRSVDTSQMGRRLEKAFIHAVKAVKRNAARKA